jgi:hypothetical protein
MKRGLTAGGGMILGMAIGIAFGHMILGMVIGLLLGGTIAVLRRGLYQDVH